MNAVRRPVSSRPRVPRGAAAATSSGRGGGRAAPRAGSSFASFLASFFASSALTEDYTTTINLMFLFLYGILGGALSCLCFFFLVFYKVRSTLDHVVRKKAIKHQAFEEVAKAAAVVPAAKVETLCKVVCFDDDVVGEVIQCRALLYSDTMVLYKVEERTTTEDHRQVVTRETLLGKINRNCAITTGERISKYHRHLNLFSRYSPIKGKATILRSKDPSVPLFMEDPNARLQERLDEMRAQRDEVRARRRSANDGTGNERTSQTSAGANTWTAKMEAQLEALTMLTKTGRASYAAGDEEAVREHREQLRQQVQRLLVPRGRRFGDDTASNDHENSEGAGTTSLEAPVRQWRSIAIKFPNRRVNERWFNLLQGTSQTLQWQYYLNHLPHTDVLNLLLARLFFENSGTDSLHNLLLDKLQKNLSNVSNNFGDNLKGDIRVDGLTVGGEVPLISNVSDCTVDQTGELDFDFDVLYRGGLMITIRLANFSYRDIHVPDLLFHIKVLELAGRLHFNVGPPPTQKFWLGCRRVPDLRLEFTQEVASHEGILNVVLNILPDMSNPVSNVVKTLLFSDMLYPSFDDFPWPVVDGPEKKKKQKEAEEAEKAKAAEEEALGASQISSAKTNKRTSKSSKTPPPQRLSGTATPAHRADGRAGSVGNGSFASTVLSGTAGKGTSPSVPNGGDRSPPPRPVSARPPRAPPQASLTPSALNSHARTAHSKATTVETPTATPALHSARNLDDEEGGDDNDDDGGKRLPPPARRGLLTSEESPVDSARRRRVGTVIRVSAPLGASTSPSEFTSGGQSTVSATARTPQRTTPVDRLDHSSTQPSTTDSNSTVRTRIVLSTPNVLQSDANGADDKLVFSGGSSSSVRASRRNRS